MIYDIDRMLELLNRDHRPPVGLAATLGSFLRIFAARNPTANRSLDWFIKRVTRAVELGQATLYFDRYGRYCGHGIWTCVPDTKEQKVREIGPDDWSAEDFYTEGDVWIIEFNALYGRMRDIAFDLCRRFPENTESISYRRHKGTKAICKRVSRGRLYGPREVECSADDQWLIASDESEGLRHSAASEMELAIRIGLAVMILGQLPEYSAMPLSAIFNRVRNPIQRRQYRIYTSPAGNPIGFYSWAWMESDELRRRGAKALSSLELGDWSEGLELFLCDAVSVDGGSEQMSQDLCYRWFPSERLFIYPHTDDRPADALRAFDPSERGRTLPGAGVNGRVAHNIARSLAEAHD